jgi:hypothetical protein
MNGQLTFFGFRTALTEIGTATVSTKMHDEHDENELPLLLTGDSIACGARRQPLYSRRFVDLRLRY